MKEPPSVVVFDLGKVLLDFDYSIAARKLAPRCDTSVDRARFFIDQSPLLHSYETGRLSTQEFFGEICRATGFKGTPDEFAASFADIFTPIPRMVELQETLRQAGIPTFIFSNTNDLAVAHVRERYPFFANFNGYILSYEHGFMKPEEAIYEIVERETQCSGGRIAYLDDRSENVEAGSRRGWKAILHESPEKSWKICRQLGLPLPLVQEPV